MNETVKKQNDWQLYKRLLSYLKTLKLMFAFSLVGFIIFAASQTAVAHLMKYFIDGLNSKNSEYLLYVPAGLVVIAFVRGLGFFMGNYLIAKVSMNIVHQIRCQLFAYFVNAPKRYYDKTNTGQMLSMLLYNVGQVSGAATDAIRVVVREGFTVIGLVVYLFWMNWQVSLLFLSVAPVLGIGVYFIGLRLKTISKRIQDSMGDITHTAKESLSAMQVVRAFGGQAHEIRRFENASMNSIKLGLKMARTTTANSPLMEFIISIALAGLMYSLLTLFKDQSAGDAIAFLAAAAMIPKPLRQISDIWGIIQRGLAASESIFETLDSELEKDTGTVVVKRATGSIEVSNLRFQYDAAQEAAIDNISFSVKPGQMIALVGHSGSGKTTLTNLLLRFYDYQSGSILLDGVELSDYQLRNLRDQFALVSQHTQLFNDSVRNNVAYGGTGQYSDEQVWAALRAANAADFVEKLDQGLDTFVGENGGLLSGGQKQRLAIARAILKNAPILILDEATSALDTQSERQIQEALDHATEHRTTFVIAHRLSTIVKADVILVFSNGKIVEMGSHAELLKQAGHYSSLYFGKQDIIGVES